MKNFQQNFDYVKGEFRENAALVAPLVERCPPIETILAHVLLNRFGWRAQGISWTSEMKGWGEEDWRRAGRA